MELAKKNGFLLHLSEKVQVYPDIAPEALAKRKELKEFVAVLRDANVRFHWASPLKIQVFYKGHSYFIFDEESGLEVLQILNLSKPPRPDRQSTKR